MDFWKVIHENVNKKQNTHTHTHTHTHTFHNKHLYIQSQTF